LTRIRTIALLAALAAALTLVASGCGGGSESPKSVVENATLEGVESGKLDASISFHSESGNTEIQLAGPFQAGGKGELPQFAVAASAKGEANGEKVDLEGSLTLLSDRAFIGLDGSVYEVDPTTFGFIRSSFEQAAQKGGEDPGNVTACQEAATGLDYGEVVENPKSETGVDVDGTSTTKVSGSLESDAAVDLLIKLLNDPACHAQLEAAGKLTPLSKLESSKQELGEALKSAHVDLYVGDDHIIRKVLAKLVVQAPGSSGPAEAEIEATLSAVNEEQKISAPAEAKPLEDLFRELGVNPLELFEGGGDIGGLLEKLGESAIGGGSSSGEAGGGSQQDYMECLQEAETAPDLQKCASLAQ
jgi:hypothetical protein